MQVGTPPLTPLLVPKQGLPGPPGPPGESGKPGDQVRPFIPRLQVGA